MKKMMKKIVDAFVSNASNRMHAIGIIASTLALTFGLAGAVCAGDYCTPGEFAANLLAKGVSLEFTQIQGNGATETTVSVPAGEYRFFRASATP